MSILVYTLDQSQFMNSLFTNDLKDLTLVFINFFIMIIYNITGYHLIIETIKYILKFIDKKLTENVTFFKKVIKKIII